MILSDHSLREELAAGRIVVEPFDERCVQPSSIDVKLSNLFRVFRNHTAGVIDVKSAVDLTEPVEIQPTMACSCSIPASSSSAAHWNASPSPTTWSAASTASRSLGRLGLIIHSTAGFIDPGFDGHITLELTNIATLPITLYPAMKVGQVSFMRMTTPADGPYGVGRDRLEVPGPARPDAEPLLGEFQQG